jgi:hypothetical protein
MGDLLECREGEIKGVGKAVLQSSHVGEINQRRYVLVAGMPKSLGP